MVQRSIEHRYITSSAGKHHSVLNSEDGAIYTFGEGHGGNIVTVDFSTYISLRVSSNTFVERFTFVALPLF